MKTIASTYEITRLIDSGGSGMVYLGRHLRLEKDIVLKADKRAISEHAMSSFRHEVETLKNLNHTYIPHVYDFVSEDGIVYTVMDYIDGESFDKKLANGERFSASQIVKWAKQILEALAYLHNRPPFGILHSDIKPANIILTPQDDICLIDFNIALALGEDGAVSVGRSQGYASPEHYGLDHSSEDSAINNKHQKPEIATDSPDDTMVSEDGQPMSVSYGEKEGEKSKASVSTGGTRKKIVLDARSDIYGLGATLYHLATGQRPARFAADVVPLTMEECAPGLAAIINKAMAPDRSKRYQTAEEMLDAFKRIHKTDPQARSFRRIRGLVAAVLTTFLAIGIFTAFVGLKRMEAEKAMLAFAESSQSALLRGDVPNAVEFGAKAVQCGIDPDLFTPPVSASARKALTDALGIYDLSDTFKSHRTLSLPSAPLMAELSPNGKLAAVVYAFEVVVVDLESGQSIATFPTTESALSEALFLDDFSLVYAGIQGLCAINILTGEELWRGQPGTAVCISADRQTIAAINRDDSYATVYNKGGNTLTVVDFGIRKQRVPSNDSYANPRDKLFSLSENGQYLAVSFADGSLTIFDTTDASNNWDTLDESDFLYFEGGFSGNKLALVAKSPQSSVFVVLDANEQVLMNGDIWLPVPSNISVKANETGIYYSLTNFIKQHSGNSEEQIAFYTLNSNVNVFSITGGDILAVTDNGNLVFFNEESRLVSKHTRRFSPDIILLSSEYALIGSRDETEMTIFKFSQGEATQSFTYDSSYLHDEARINLGGKRVMFFSIYGFKLYDTDGIVISEQEIPESGSICDQQFFKESGNLAVMYKDALRIYSGQDGKLIFEETGLQSVFYAPYGISVLDNNGYIRLIDGNNGQTLFSDETMAGESFAAYCGMVVTNDFLGGSKLIGAAKTDDGYRFAISDVTTCTVFDQSGNELFSVPVSGIAEAFFTSKALVISPLHGFPVVYNLKNGAKISDLEKDAYLTYIQPLDDYIVSQYISWDGEQFGVLLDSDFQPIAYLDCLSDISNGQLVFDYPQGALRQSRVYSIEEILERANRGSMK